MASNYLIQINRDARTLTLFHGGAVVGSYPVAIGKPSTPTPLGNFSIVEKRMNPGGAFGARWMRFYSGYGIHGTNNPSSIGKAVSNGCVRMYNSDAIQVYNKVSYGTPVRIIGTSRRARVLKLGVFPGADVRRIQKMLQEFGFYPGPLHGSFDVFTANSVAQFQKNMGLQIDGMVNPQTLLVMYEYYSMLFGDMEP